MPLNLGNLGGQSVVLKCCRIGSILGNTSRSTVQAHLLCPTTSVGVAAEAAPKELCGPILRHHHLSERDFPVGGCAPAMVRACCAVTDRSSWRCASAASIVHRGGERGGARQTGQPDAVLWHAGATTRWLTRCGSGCDSRRYDGRIHHRARTDLRGDPRPASCSRSSTPPSVARPASSSCSPWSHAGGDLVARPDTSRRRSTSLEARLEAPPAWRCSCR